MSPTINEYSARIGIDRAEQSAQRVVKTDDKNRGSNRLQILRQKTHPQLFACANDKYGDEQNDEIAFEPEEIREPREAVHAQLLSELLLRFKSPQRMVNAGSSFSSDRPGRFFAGFPSRSNQAYRTGKTINVRNVELRMPPMRTVTPLSAINPIAAVMLKGIPRNHSESTPPVTASGIPV